MSRMVGILNLSEIGSSTCSFAPAIIRSLSEFYPPELLTISMKD